MAESSRSMSLPGVAPGEGRRLLDGIVAEADRKGQRLVLDAANDRLVDYYGTLGFRAIGAAATMPYGERVTRMVRPPCSIGTRGR